MYELGSSSPGIILFFDISNSTILKGFPSRSRDDFNVSRFSFNKSVSASSFQNALKINSTSTHTIVGYDYLNNSAIVEVEFDLDFDSSYTITLSGAIGTNGEVLS